MLAKLSDSFQPGSAVQHSLSNVRRGRGIKYIAFLNSVGFITGALYGTYRPDDNMSRAEFAILACRYRGFSRAEKADSAIAKDIWRTATLPLLEIMVTSAVMKTASPSK